MNIAMPAFNTSTLNDDYSTIYPDLSTAGIDGEITEAGWNENNADTFDWDFWDQLLKDPDMFQTASS